MNVTMHGAEPCVFCGYRVGWFLVAGVRVNKRSLRTRGMSLVVQLWHECPECGRYQMSDQGPLRWVFSPDSQVRVDVLRVKRGWLDAS